MPGLCCLLLAGERTASSPPHCPALHCTAHRTAPRHLRATKFYVSSNPCNSRLRSLKSYSDLERLGTLLHGGVDQALTALPHCTLGAARRARGAV